MDVHRKSWVSQIKRFIHFWLSIDKGWFLVKLRIEYSTFVVLVLQKHNHVYIWSYYGLIIIPDNWGGALQLHHDFFSEINVVRLFHRLYNQVGLRRRPVHLIRRARIPPISRRVSIIPEIPLFVLRNCQLKCHLLMRNLVTGPRLFKILRIWLVKGTGKAYSLISWKFVLKVKQNRCIGLLMTALKIVILLFGISLLRYMVTLMNGVLLLLYYFILNSELTMIWILLYQISPCLPIKLFPQIRTLHRFKLKKLSLRVTFTNLKQILYLKWVNVPLWRKLWVKWKGWWKQLQKRKLYPDRGRGNFSGQECRNWDRRNFSRESGHQDFSPNRGRRDFSPWGHRDLLPERSRSNFFV